MAGNSELGLFPLDMVLLPGERTALHVFEPRYRQLVADTTLGSLPFVLVRAEGERVEEVGCAARFAALVRRFPDGRMTLIAAGEGPVRLIEQTDGRLYRSARVRMLEDEPAPDDPAAREAAEEAFRAATGLAGELPASPGVPLSYGLAGAVELPTEVKQRLLESRREPERLTLLVEALRAAAERSEHERMAAERAASNGRVSHR